MTTRGFARELDLHAIDRSPTPILPFQQRSEPKTQQPKPVSASVASATSTPPDPATHAPRALSREAALSRINITNTRPEHAEALGELQRRAYPTLHPQELFSAAHYRRHLETFPEAQFVALDTGRNNMPVGATSALRYDFNFDAPQHKFIEIIGYGWLNRHEPMGAWLYGCDMSVDPEYQGFGIASMLYKARQDYVKRANLRGQIAVGMMPGYSMHRDRLSVDEYAEQVNAGAIFDPTLSKQLKSGFRFVQVIHDYLHDERSGNAGALIVWDNPYYFPLDPHVPHVGSRRVRESRRKTEVSVRRFG